MTEIRAVFYSNSGAYPTAKWSPWAWLCPPGLGQDRAREERPPSWQSWHQRPARDTGQCRAQTQSILLKHEQKWFPHHLSPPAAHLALPTFTGTGHSQSVGGARPEVVTDVFPLGSAVNGLPPPSWGKEKHFTLPNLSKNPPENSLTQLLR